VFGAAAAVGDAKQGGAAFNYDSPAALELWRVALDALLPAMAKASGGAAPWTIMAANEPYASQPASVGTPPGDLSLAAFQAFLSDRYGGNVSALNSRWGGTRFAAFGDVTKYPSKPDVFRRGGGTAGHVASFLDGTAWLCNRTTWFFGRLAAQTRASAQPAALLHVKNKNYGSWSAWDDGFDREALAAQLGVVGVDTRNMPGETAWTRVGDPFWEAGAWAMDWRAEAVSYALMRSVGRVASSGQARLPAPGLDALCRRAGVSGCDSPPAAPATAWRLPAFDSESHFSSVSTVRVMAISWDHGRTSGLLATASGLAMRTRWYWDREPTGRVVSGLGEWGPGWSGTASAAGSQSMQPAFMAGAAHAAREAATAGAALAALADDTGTSVASAVGCLLRCDASRVLGGNCSAAALEGFAALSLASVSAVRIVTDRQLAQSWGLAGCSAVLVPSCLLATDDAVAAVAAWAAAGASKGGNRSLLVVPADSGGGSGAGSLGRLAFGVGTDGAVRDEASLAFLRLPAVTVVSLGPAASMAAAADEAMSSAGVRRALRCGPVGSAICRWAVDETDGSIVAMVLNPRPQAADIALMGPDGQPANWEASDEATGLPVRLSAGGAVSLRGGESVLLRLKTA